MEVTGGGRLAVYISQRGGADAAGSFHFNSLARKQPTAARSLEDPLRG